MPRTSVIIALFLVASSPSVVTTVGAQDRAPIPLPEVAVDAPYERPAVPQRATTGTKTDTPLMDVPASVQVVPKELLQDQGAYSVDGITRNVSGVNHAAQSAYGFFNNFVVRGLSQQFLRDGLPDGPAINGYFRTLTDVERIEVLKGPGSALYGSGQPGGTINLVSKMPSELPYYSLYGSGGSFGTYRFAVDLGGPLGTPDLGYRLNGAYFYTDGFRDVSTTVREIYPTLRWRLSPEHTVTVKFNYSTVAAVADTVGIPFRGRTLVGIPRDSKLYTPFADTDQDVFRAAIDVESRLTDSLTLRNAVVVLQRDLTLARNAANPTFLANGVTLTGRNFREQTDHATDVLYHVEPVWKATTGSINHTILGGFEYQFHLLESRRQTAALPNIATVFTPVIPEQSPAGLTFVPNFDRHAEFANYALYAQDQVALSQYWKARAGLRWDQMDIEDFNRIARPRAHRSDSVLSYNAGLVFQPVPVTSFYTGVARSVFASFSAEAARGALPPEKGLQYEVGNKTLLLDGRISINVALYHTEREDFLVTIGPDQAPIGKQKTQGVELDVASEPVAGWKLYANYAYQDTELVKLSPTDPSAGKGHSAVGVPLNSAAVWSTYEIQSGALRGLGGGGGVTFKDGIYLDTLNTQRLPAYAVVDLVAFYHTKHVDYQINLNNAFDTTYYFTGRNGAGAPGDPISVFANVVVKY